MAFITSESRAANISSNSASNRTKRGRNRSPAAVNANPRVERTTNVTPRLFSSCVTRLVTTEGATPSSRAAPEKLCSRATFTKAATFTKVLIPISQRES